jgi:small subunit ribosomal protein S3
VEKIFPEVVAIQDQGISQRTACQSQFSKIIIERTLKLITVTVNTAVRYYYVSGQEVDKLKEELKKITKKEVQINIFEVKRPELDANIVATISPVS